MEVNAGQALGMEFLVTFQLVFTIFSVEEQRRREGAEPGNLAIGFSLSAGIFTAVRAVQICSSDTTCAIYLCLCVVLLQTVFPKTSCDCNEDFKENLFLISK